MRDEIAAQISAARAREAADRAAGLRASSARYDPVTDYIIVELTHGYLFGFPARDVPGLEQLTPEQRGQFELSPSGGGIHWNDDVDISVPGLLAKAFGAVDRRD